MTTIYVIILILYFSQEWQQWENKSHKNYGCVLSFSCLRGIETRGEDNDDHKSLSFAFHRNNNKKKKTQRKQLYAIIFMSKKSWNKKWRQQWFLWSSPSFVFQRHNAKEEKNHENNVYVPSSLCLRGDRKGGENDDNHRSLDLIFYFSQE